MDGLVQQQSLGLCHGSWEIGRCKETHWGSGHCRKVPRGPSNGFDPDIGTSGWILDTGIDKGFYPNNRSIGAGLNVSF